MTHQSTHKGDQDRIGPLGEKLAGELSGARLTFSAHGEGALAVFLAGEDPDRGEEAFAAVFDGGAGDTDGLLKEAFFEPEGFGLSGEAPLLVVDPSPSEDRGALYRKVGALVVSDARFAAREILRRGEEAAGDSVGERESDSPQSSTSPAPSQTGAQPEESPKAPLAPEEDWDMPTGPGDLPYPGSGAQPTEQDDHAPHPDSPGAQTYDGRPAAEEEPLAEDRQHAPVSQESSQDPPQASHGLSEGDEGVTPQREDQGLTAEPEAPQEDSEAQTAESPPTATGAGAEKVRKDEGEPDYGGLSQGPNAAEEHFFSESRERLYRIRAALEGEADEGRSMTSEQLAALEALRQMGPMGKAFRGVKSSLGFSEDRLDRLVAEARPPRYRQISADDAAGLRACPFPGVILCANNKGGCGKTFITTNLAAALAKMCRPRGLEEGLKVLIVEQNFGNSDVRARVATGPGRRLGLVEYLRDTEEAAARGQEPPSLSGYASSVSGVDNLYALFISGDEEQWRHKGKITPAELDRFYEAAGAEFDFLVVDVQNGLPQAEDIVAEELGFWLSVADVHFLVVDPSSGVEHGSEFIEGARRVIEAEARETPDGAPSAAIVPVFNKWREGSSKAHLWERGVIALGADYAIFPEDYRAADGATPQDPGARPPAYFHRIPADDPAYDFCLEKRQIALESRRFKGPFEALGIDALTRIKLNNLDYFKGSTPRTDGPPHEDTEEEV